MKRIFVTGSRGMLGCHLVPYLRACGHEVVVTSRQRDSHVSADLANQEQTNSALDAVMPGVIVNLAALTNVDECERHPQRAYLSNVRVVENLVSWIKRGGDECHLVHVSTDQVYDGAGPHSEDAITLTNFYGFSKYAGELAAAKVPSTILRTNFFGKSKCVGRESLSDWLTRSLLDATPITVFDDVLFSPLMLNSLIAQLERVIRDPHRGVFNLGSKDGMSKADFGFALADALGLPAKSMVRGRVGSILEAAYRPKDMRMNSSHYEMVYRVQLPRLSEEIRSLGAADVL